MQPQDYMPYPFRQCQTGKGGISLFPFVLFVFIRANHEVNFAQVICIAN